MKIDHEVLIVGAGFGGIGMGIQLQRLGISDFLIIDREPDLGGTWQVNHYPGLAVDIQSSLYSFSFEPNPYWSRRFAPGPEIKAYADQVANKYNLVGQMQFDTAISQADWDDEAQCWQVTGTKAGADWQCVAKYLFLATGFLSQPKLPEIDGINDFAGKIIHTSAWDDDYDLTGKRVAVIGTGATSIQLVPAVLPQVAEMTVFQRTPIWLTPKPDAKISKSRQEKYANNPRLQRLDRALAQTALETLWIVGVLHTNRAPMLNLPAVVLSKQFLNRSVKDPEIRAKLQPEYGFGCKRPSFSNDYFAAFNDPKLTLETNKITEITKTGISTTTGSQEFDVIVLATGYSLWETNFPAIKIRGRAGFDLGQHWRDHQFESYEGITAPKCPNLVMLAAPYSYSGLNYFSTLEAQMQHVDRLFTHMRATGHSIFEPTAAAQDRFVAWAKQRLTHSVWGRAWCGAANSYYFDTHGEPTLVKPVTTREGMRRAASFPLADYNFK